MFKGTKHKIIVVKHITVAIYKFNSTTGGSQVLLDYIIKNYNIVSYPYYSNLFFLATVGNQFCNVEKKKLDKTQNEIQNYMYDYYNIVDTTKNSKHKKSTQTERKESPKITKV